MRRLLLFLTLGVTAFAGREGNFTIRFDTAVVLQPGVQLPFEIRVSNDLHQPLHAAQVTLAIETKDHRDASVYKAPEVSEGVYLAKPVFGAPGEWNVTVEVHRNDQVTTRTKEIVIPKAI